MLAMFSMLECDRPAARMAILRTPASFMAGSSSSRTLACAA